MDKFLSDEVASVALYALRRTVSFQRFSAAFHRHPSHYCSIYLPPTLVHATGYGNKFPSAPLAIGSLMFRIKIYTPQPLLTAKPVPRNIPPLQQLSRNVWLTTISCQITCTTGREKTGDTRIPRTSDKQRLMETAGRRGRLIHQTFNR